MSHIFKVIHVLMMVFVGVTVSCSWGGGIPLQGLFCGSVVSSHSMGLVCVNVGVVRVS